MRKYRNPNIIPYVPKDGKNYYYAFELLTYSKKRLHYYLLSRSRWHRCYDYFSFNKRETFYYTSYLNIFKNLYLNFLNYEYSDLKGAEHDYFILSPSVEVVIRKEYPYA